MTPATKTLDPFARALLDPHQPTPAGLRAWNGSDPSVRFDVYRNNVVSSLVGALLDTFPVVQQLVGAEFFDAMARVFVRSHPPTSPVLAEFGESFADFIDNFEPAARLSYLADVARLERARVRAFHAAGAIALPSERISAHLARPQTLPEARITLHPSLGVLRSRYAVVSVWAAHQSLGDLAAVDPFVPEAALVLRRDDDAAVIAVPEATAIFAQQLAQGAGLGAAATQATERPTGDGGPFDLTRSLALLMHYQAIIDWRQPS